jgi:hypothetical protein
VAAALDAGTAACAALNSAYFIDRLLGGVDRLLSRRLAVAALTIVSVGALVEALALLAIAGGPQDAGVLTSAPWAIVRVLPFAGAAAVSALIARKALLR